VTDFAPAYWNAFSKVFDCSKTNRLLCSWHVDKAWKKNIRSKISNPTMQVAVYKSLFLLRMEPNEEKFERMFKTLIESMSQDEQTEDFPGITGRINISLPICQKMGRKTSLDMSISVCLNLNRGEDITKSI
jgi:hypothetical protein